MNKKELKKSKDSLDKRIEDVQTSKAAARKLLNRLRILTPTGKLRSSKERT